MHKHILSFIALKGRLLMTADFLSFDNALPLKSFVLL